jgi:surface protein
MSFGFPFGFDIGGSRGGSSALRPFIIEVKTDNVGTSNDNQFQFTGAVGDYDVVAKQSGVIVDTFNDLSGEETITFSDGAGTYILEITPKEVNGFSKLSYANGGDKNKLTKHIQWGDIVWSSLDSMFWGCSNISFEYTDIPDLSEVTLMRLPFASTSFNSTVNNWDVSNITDMNNAFRLTGSFNQPINNWDVSNVTNMQNMFNAASAFNQPINDWNVSNVENMSNMLNDSSFSVANLTSVYEDWSQLTLKQNVAFSAGTIQYNASGQAGRDIMTGTYNWGITDGGQV